MGDMSALDIIVEMRALLDEMEKDFIKCIEKGNKSAGIRARKGLMKISRVSKTARQAMLEEFNAGQYAKKPKE